MDQATPQRRPTVSEKYRGFTIDYAPKPIPSRAADWDWSHEDYDGPPDRRCGTARSVDEAKADIDELLAGQKGDC
jgi:hypothetical protein